MPLCLACLTCYPIDPASHTVGLNLPIIPWHCPFSRCLTAIGFLSVTKLDAEVAELRHKLKTSLHKEDITRFRDTIDKHLDEAHGRAKFDDLPPAEQKAAKQVYHASHCLSRWILK